MKSLDFDEFIPLKVLTKYRIPNVIGAIDGSHIPLDNLRGIPAPFVKRDFYCRKGFNSLNVLIFAGRDF